MHIRPFLLLFLTSVALHAFVDSDLDGVEDGADRCANTPLSDLVDTSGCTVKSLKNEHHYDIVFGVGYSQLDAQTLEKTDTLTTSLQIDYYYQAVSVQFSTSRYQSDGDTYSSSGMNDTTLAAYYRFQPTQELSVRPGGGVIFPTYESGYGNEAADLFGSLDLGYKLEDTTLFGGLIYTVVNDDDVSGSATYQNTVAAYFGAGYYPSPESYASVSYYRSDSIYTDIEPIKNISLYGYYSFDAHWFGTAGYALGLSDSASDNSLTLRLGYYF